MSQKAPHWFPAFLLSQVLFLAGCSLYLNRPAPDEDAARLPLEQRRGAMFSVFHHAYSLVHDLPEIEEFKVLELEEAAKLLRSDGGAAAERRRRRAIVKLAAAGVERHRVALEILGAPIEKIQSVLQPYAQAPFEAKEVILDHLLTAFWGVINAGCMTTTPVTVVTLDPQTDLVTVTVTLSVNRTPSDLAPVLDPQNWSTCSDYFGESFVAEPDSSGQYPTVCTPYPTELSPPPDPGSTWSGVLFERFVTSSGIVVWSWFQNLLKIDQVATPDHFHFDYELHTALCSKVFPFEFSGSISGGVDKDWGYVDAQGGLYGWSLVQTFKALDFSDRPTLSGDLLNAAAVPLLHLMGSETELAVCCDVDGNC